MSEFDEIQKLIRLKRHERPSEDFVEEFVRSFQDRQRSEMLHRSARGLLWERVTTYFSEMLNPKWAWASATVTAVALLGFMLRPATPVSGSQVAHNDGFEVKAFATADPDAFKADVESYLKAVEFEPKGSADSQFISPPRIIQPKGGMLPAGLRFEIQSVPVPQSAPMPR